MLFRLLPDHFMYFVNPVIMSTKLAWQKYEYLKLLDPYFISIIFMTFW